MKIAVIGGAGYIGSHTTRELLDRGHEVCVFDNLSSGLEQNLFPEAGFVKGDILHPDEIGKFLNEFKPEGLVHLAAFKAAGESMINPEKYSVNNITGSINILNAASAAGVKYFVFSSSAATYGAPKYQPVDEEHPTDPENYYGYTKLAIEGFLKWYDKLRGIKFAALRYFNAAGYDVKGRINGLEKNPGFSITPTMAMSLAIGVMYGDLAMRVLYHTRPYEKNKGESERVLESWHDRIVHNMLHFSKRTFVKNIKGIVNDFDNIEKKINEKFRARRYPHG